MISLRKKIPEGEFEGWEATFFKTGGLKNSMNCRMAEI